MYSSSWLSTGDVWDGANGSLEEIEVDQSLPALPPGSAFVFPSEMATYSDLYDGNIQYESIQHTWSPESRCVVEREYTRVFVCVFNERAVTPAESVAADFCVRAQRRV